MNIYTPSFSDIIDNLFSVGNEGWRSQLQTIGERKYAIVQIMKNGQVISSQAIEAKLVRPVITIGSSQTKIDTNPDSQGSESQDMSGI